MKGKTQTEANKQTLAVSTMSFIYIFLGKRRDSGRSYVTPIFDLIRGQVACSTNPQEVYVAGKSLETKWGWGFNNKCWEDF